MEEIKLILPHGVELTAALRARAESIASAFHAEYERLAPGYNYETRRESAVPWEDVPVNNRSLMIHVAANLLIDGIVE